MTNKCPNCGHPFKIQVVPLERLGKGATFQSTAEALPLDDSHIIEQRSFWASDGITYAVAGLFAGGVVLTFCWWYDLDGGIVATLVTFIVGVGPHVLKIFLHAPPKLPPPPGKTTITIEQQSPDKKHWLLAELDFIRSPEKFYLAMSEIDKQQRWTKAITTGAGLSQGQHDKLKDKFVEMGYLMPLPNNAKGFELTIQGRRAIKRIVSFGRKNGHLKMMPHDKGAMGMSDHSVEKGSKRRSWLDFK